MLNFVLILWIFGMIIGFINGLLSVKCYFYLTGGGIETLYQENRPKVNNLMKSYRKGDSKVEDPKLRAYYDWIFYTKWAAILSFIIALFLYVGAFAL